MNTNRELLWRVYSQVYDIVMASFLPYQILTERVAASLSPSPGSRILDAGCGTGHLLHCLLRWRSDLEAVGIDFSTAMLNQARAKSKDSRRITWRKVNLNYPLPFSDGEFDAIACVNVLYAVDEPLFLLQELRRVLREGGRLVLVTPIYRPKMGSIFGEHVQQLKERNPKAWPVILLGQIIRLAPSLVVFVAANRSIQKDRSFHFFKEDQLYRMLLESGFRTSPLEKVYGDQAWLAVGEKGTKPTL
ncbi:MAG: methyltransferase domain-containing protein [Bacillota bacterium]